MESQSRIVRKENKSTRSISRPSRSIPKDVVINFNDEYRGESATMLKDKEMDVELEIESPILNEYSNNPIK